MPVCRSTELKSALGSLAIAGYEVTAERVLRAGVSATNFASIEHSTGRSTQHPARAAPSTPAPAPSSASPLEVDLRADRPLGALAGRAHAGEGAVPAARRSRSGDSSDAAREGPSPRGRRARLDHRHRRRGVRARVGRRRSDRLLAAERRRRHGPVGARPVPGAGAGDAQAARRCAGLQRRRPEGAGDADRRADRHELCRRRSARFPRWSLETVGYGAGDRDNPGTPNVLRVLIGRGRRSAARRPRRRHRVRDRRHEPADFRRGHGQALRGRRARGVLRAGPDEEEPARHAADRGRARPSCRPALVGRHLQGNDDDRPAVSTRSSASASSARSSRVDTPVGAVRFKLAWRDGRVVNAVPEFDDCARIAAASNLSVKDVQAIAVQAYGARR